MTPSEPLNQLVILVVSGRQSGELMENLSKKGFYFTKIDSTGGGFQEPTVCLLIGFNSSRMSGLLQILNDCCQSYRQYIPAQMHLQPGNPPLPVPMIEAQVGGAVIYTMNIERFEQL